MNKKDEMIKVLNEKCKTLNFEKNLVIDRFQAKEEKIKGLNKVIYKQAEVVQNLLEDNERLRFNEKILVYVSIALAIVISVMTYMMMV
jgi:hypothetical protein